MPQSEASTPGEQLMAKLVVAAFADTTEATRGWGSVSRMKTGSVVLCASVMAGKRKMEIK